jgi:hypothetical protein
LLGDVVYHQRLGEVVVVGDDVAYILVRREYWDARELR